MYQILKKIKKDHAKCKIYEYFIKYKEDRPDGEAAIFLQELITLKHPWSGISNQQFKRWKQCGLKNNDLFACLDDFYPHGRFFPERKKYLRKGVGKNILKQLLIDIDADDPKIIYAIPTNKTIVSFFASQNWISDYKNNRVMYKFLS